MGPHLRSCPSHGKVRADTSALNDQPMIPSLRFVKTWLITALVNFHAMRGDMADEARDSISSEEVKTLQSLASCNLKNIEVKSFQKHLTLEKKFSTTSNTAGEKVVKQVTVGHWGNVMPPVIRGNLVPSNAVTAIQVQKAFRP